MMMPLLHYGKRDTRASDDLRRGRICLASTSQVKSNGNYSLIARIEFKKPHNKTH